MAPPVVVITGASDGIGAAAARQLAAGGAQVIVIGRNPDKTRRVADGIGAPHYLADFARLDDVRALADALRRDLPRIDVLANNAGGVMGPRLLTVDGNERTVQVNHLAPFLLTTLLMDRLTASSARVITTSSSAHTYAGRLDLDDLTLEHHYSPQRAYGKTKLMNILFTRELHARYHDAGLCAAAFHPGVVATSFSKEYGGLTSLAYTTFVARFLRTPDEGAATLTWLATSEPGRDWVSGEYYKDEKLGRATRLSRDPSLAKALWERSAEITGVA